MLTAPSRPDYTSPEAGRNARHGLIGEGAGMSEQITMKRGRPAENVFDRQREIFEATLPLLKDRGARALTMRAAAAASFMSVGGLNHYFPTKTDLLFWPMLPHVCEAAHHDFTREHQSLRLRDPEAFLERYIDFIAAAIVDYCTPSVQAAVELGSVEFRWMMTDGMMPVAVIERFEEIRGALSPDEYDRLTRGIRRAFVGATLDPLVSSDELARDIWAQLDSVRARVAVLAS